VSVVEKVSVGLMSFASKFPLTRPARFLYHLENKFALNRVDLNFMQSG
jgi:hypothetical protein